MRHALVVGGAGALGRSVVRRLKSGSLPWRVASLDFRSNDDADDNFEALGAAQDDVVDRTRSFVSSGNGSGLGLVVCVAGGFEMGGIKDGYQAIQRMHEMNAKPAFLSAYVATELLSKPEGLLVLTGAKAALEYQTTFAVGYGMAKDATHYLARQFVAQEDQVAATPGSSGPRRCRVLLPTTIDTPANRQAMPDEDFSKWSCSDVIADQIAQMANDPTALAGDQLFVEV